MAGRRRLRSTLVAGIAVAGLTFGVLSAPVASAENPSSLEMYTAEVTAQQVGDLRRAGFDVVASEVSGDRLSVKLVLTDGQAAGLAAKGIAITVSRNADGKSSRELAAEQAAGGYEVWRSWDEDGGIRDELYQLADDNPGLVKLVVLGKTHQGRELIAVKVTEGGGAVADGSRPAVLYTSLQHAREWIAVEVNRRLLHLFVDRWKAGDAATRDMLAQREVWFVIVANPDGYQYSFDTERLWRKNLRDNDGDGEITSADGVDPNRNYPEHWGYDEEGSSSQFSSETYRGPAAASEPETQAIIALYDRVPFKFHVNWHSTGEWLLYAEGWQTATPTADDPIYYALSGNLDRPAIKDFEPGLGSDILYVTNGETTDYAHAVRGALSWTPELGEGTPGSGFVFPDDEELIQAEFERSVPFARDVIQSAADPAHPVSRLGIETKPLYVKSKDTYKAGLPMANFTFDYSYGDPQEVRVIASREIDRVRAKYRINGAPAVRAPMSDWEGGERYGQTGVYYRTMTGFVTGTEPGDHVRVRFRGDGQRTRAFKYKAVSESENPVLLLSAEDYTGASPDQPGGPNYLDYYGDALTDNGVGYDVYDVDARKRKAADSLGVLSHYDAVVWYTGDDVVTREPGWEAGNASRLAQDEVLEMREFLNEGGGLFYTGKWAGSQFTANTGLQLFDPTQANQECTSDPDIQARCRQLAGSGDQVGDVLQYWLGAYLVINDGGTHEDGLYDVDGVDDPINGLSFGFNGADSAQNQDHSNSFLSTSGFLNPEDYPLFESWAPGKWAREGGPFEPHTGDYYVYSEIADVSYKRLTRTIDVPAGGATMSFWTSNDIEVDWDQLFVEAHTVGADDWTTLEDQNGHTTQDTGQSCPAGWRDLHPWLDHYQTLDEDGTCTSTGTTGEWWASSVSSGGWQQWSVDLGAYAGDAVEVSIAYASDWATQGLGVFIDDIEVSTGEGTTSFEDGLDGWEVTGPPPGSAPNSTDFVRTTAAGFPEGAVVATPHSVFSGFGLEGVTDAARRAEIMGRVLDHLM